MTYEIYDAILEGLKEKDSYYSWDRGLPFGEIEEHWEEITKNDLFRILVTYDYAVSQSFESHNIFNRIYNDFIEEFEKDYE